MVEADQLERIALQVVELLLAGPVLWRTCSARSGSPLKFPGSSIKSSRPRSLPGVLGDRDQGAPVHHRAGARVRRRRAIVGARSALIARSSTVYALRNPRAAHHERHPDRLLVDALSSVGDPVLAVEVAVVGGVDDQACCRARRWRSAHRRPAPRPRRPRAATRARSGTCAGCRRSGPSSGAAGSGSWRLVGDVLLVEVGGLRQRLGSNACAWRGRRLRRVARSRWAGSGSVVGDVGRRVGEPEEEGLSPSVPGGRRSRPPSRSARPA